MTTFANVYRDLTCGAAATLITVVLALSFVESTAVPPGARAATPHSMALQAQHAWFGQPQPAVLVD